MNEMKNDKMNEKKSMKKRVKSLESPEPNRSSGEKYVKLDESKPASNLGSSKTPFESHFNTVLDESLADKLQNEESRQKLIKSETSPIGGKRFYVDQIGPSTSIVTNGSKSSGRDESLDEKWERLGLKPSLMKNVSKNCQLLNGVGSSRSSDLIVENVRQFADCFYPRRCMESESNHGGCGVIGESGADLMELYALHVVNYCLNNRQMVVGNNAKLDERKKALLASKESKKPMNEAGESDEKNGDEYRDQGLTRPKVLILLPFRSSALKFVQIIIRLLYGQKDRNKSGKDFVTNKKRFVNEFGYEDSEVDPSKPGDYNELFDGNTDDCFRVGMAIAKKSLKLFTDFYSSDILLCSPLGLRMAIGADGEKSYEYDFLSSIQLLIMDQADIFLQQNWQHVLHIMDHLHRQPSEQRGVDYNRVRLWELNGWGSLYRQTLMFSAISTPELRSIFTKYCRNYSGFLDVAPYFRPNGVLPLIQAANIPQVFQRFQCETVSEQEDERFAYFINKVLPEYQDSGMKHCLIFVSSYFDYVRLRNHFKKETISSVQICEYSKAAKIAAARALFSDGQKFFLMYSERLHFFRRYRIRGVHHLIFYQLPTYSEYYWELCDMVGESVARNNSGITPTATVVYSRFDGHRLAPVVGPKQTKLMINSTKKIHTISAN